MADLQFLAKTRPVHIDGINGRMRSGTVAPFPDEQALELLENYPRDFKVIGEYPKLYKTAMGRASASNLQIALPDGIGDAHWTLLKLESMRKYLGIKKLTVITQITPKHNAAEFLELIPFIDVVKQKKDINLSVASKDGWFVKNKDLYYLWAFQGIRRNECDINKWLPEFAVNYDYPINIPQEATDSANATIKELGYKPVIFHLSWRGFDQRQMSGSWTANHHDEFAKLIFSKTKNKILITGRKFEKEQVEIFLDKFGRDKYIDLTDKFTVPQLLALVKQSKLVFGFQSGITFLSIHFKVPSVLLWSLEGVTKCSGFKYKREFMTSFVPPKALNNWYFPCVLGEDSPKTIWKKINHII